MLQNRFEILPWPEDAHVSLYNVVYLLLSVIVLLYHVNTYT